MFAAIAVAAALAAATNSYNVQALVTNTADSSLVNGWGLSAGPTTPWWVSDNGTNLSTLYQGTGTKAALTVTVAGGPTGTVFNGDANAFLVTQAGKSGNARFLFSTEGGQILGWNNTVNATAALVGADMSSQGAVFKGLAISRGKVYATDFHNGKVDVFDSSFKPVTTTGGFVDKTIPKGYAPFGIQTPGGNIAVTYALQDAPKQADVRKPGKGFVALSTPAGGLAARVARRG